MSKAPEHTYAHALAAALDRGMEPNVLAKRAQEILAERGHEKLLPKVLRALRTLLAQRHNRGRVELSVARKADEARAREAAQALLVKHRITPEQIQVRLDENLIGGWQLRLPSWRYDASFKRQLHALYRKTITTTH